MKLFTTFIALLITVTVAAQPKFYTDVTAGLTSRLEGRLNVEPGFIVARHISLEANIMIGQLEGIDCRYGATAGYEFGKRPFALRLYTGANYGDFFRPVQLSEGNKVDVRQKAIKPMVGAKLLYGSGAVDLRYNTHDISLTVGFQLRELVNYLRQSHTRTAPTERLTKYYRWSE